MSGSEETVLIKKLSRSNHTDYLMMISVTIIHKNKTAPRVNCNLSNNKVFYFPSIKLTNLYH
ncbi:hypothetical protein CWR46_08340 [Klebsiella pneumoniae]|nr:hypothetical protein CWR46_08340 [Klebsiella pneumoniae]